MQKCAKKTEMIYQYFAFNTDNRVRSSIHAYVCILQRFHPYKWNPVLIVTTIRAFYPRCKIAQSAFSTIMFFLRQLIQYCWFFKHTKRKWNKQLCAVWNEVCSLERMRQKTQSIETLYAVLGIHIAAQLRLHITYRTREQV